MKKKSKPKKRPKMKKKPIKPIPFTQMAPGDYWPMDIGPLETY